MEALCAAWTAAGHKQPGGGLGLPVALHADVTGLQAVWRQPEANQEEEERGGVRISRIAVGVVSKRTPSPMALAGTFDVLTLSRSSGLTKPRCGESTAQTTWAQTDAKSTT